MSDVIMSVQEIIDSAFGDPDSNTVNFRLLKTVLLILSSQLRILDRHVQINIDRRLKHRESKVNLTVSEILIHATDKKKKKKAQNKRANSHEEPARTPTPMTSVHSLNKQKLLIVGSEGREPRLSVVTQDQFEELAGAVHQLEARFQPVGIPDFPENIEFIKALREGASLTEAMAAFQISARLQACESAFERMCSLLTELARNTPGVNLSQFKALEKTFGCHGEADTFETPADEGVIMHEPSEITQTESVCVEIQALRELSEKVEEPMDCVTHSELHIALDELYDEVLENVKNITTHAKANSSRAEKTLNELKYKLASSLDLADRFENLEAAVAENLDKFNALDNCLTSQITSYQDQLSQMQYDLEVGLTKLEEALSNLGTDPEVIAELSRNFSALQEQVDQSAVMQKLYKNVQTSLANDLVDLWKQIELVCATKADREEVADAFRDKAGISELNGMVTLEHFGAVTGSLEKKICASYDKFNSQELVWQKIVDDLIKFINEKGDWAHFCALRDDMNHHLNELRCRVNDLAELVGEPQAVATSKALFRDTKCVSCSAPAHMDMKVPEKLPALPALRRPSADGAEAPDRPREYGDPGICFPGQPIPHPRDPRAHVCQRYCGGSHTTLRTISRAPHGMILTPLPREISNTLGTDGKVYKTEEVKVQKPCFTCNVPQPPQPAEGEIAPEQASLVSNTGLSDELSHLNWLEA